MSEECKIWQCQGPNCGYIYNPEKGCKKSKIPKDVPFEELPDTWKCPLCGVGKKWLNPCKDCVIALTTNAKELLNWQFFSSY